MEENELPATKVQVIIEEGSASLIVQEEHIVTHDRDIKEKHDETKDAEHDVTEQLIVMNAVENEDVSDNEDDDDYETSEQVICSDVIPVDYTFTSNVISTAGAIYDEIPLSSELIQRPDCVMTSHNGLSENMGLPTVDTSDTQVLEDMIISGNTTNTADMGSTVFELSRRIRVFLRVRPLMKSENKSDEAIKISETNKAIRVQSSQSGNIIECSFDHVFTDLATQVDIYAAIQSSIQASLNGYNATVFAYGQTGTGKTHTIFGDGFDNLVSKTNGTADEADTSYVSKALLSVSSNPTWGIIPRALIHILDHFEKLQSDTFHVEIRCSYLQIYNDRLFDLLTDKKRQKPLMIREQPNADGSTNVILQGLSSEVVNSLSDAIQVLRRGKASRIVRETEGNAASSRSHAIVQINISTEKVLPNGDKQIRRSRLNLVDLAGSEKWNTDLGMEDAHSQELKNINTSLSALGNCISALTEAGRKHIPYRDSTLTRVLQDSFGGNTQCCLIATISASLKSTDETIRTLQFADRARSVIQVIRINETISGPMELAAARSQITKLKEKLEQENKRRNELRQKDNEEWMHRLQIKEKELKKLGKQNSKLLTQKEEDLKRIKTLEDRVIELESMMANNIRVSIGGPTHQKLPHPPLSARSSNTTISEQDEDQTRLSGSNLRIEKTHQKPSAKQNQNPKSARKSSQVSHHTTSKQEEEQEGKSYKQLLERYALKNSAQKTAESSSDMDARRSVNPLDFEDTKNQLVNHVRNQAAINMSNQESTPVGTPKIDYAGPEVNTPQADFRTNTYHSSVPQNPFNAQRLVLHETLDNSQRNVGNNGMMSPADQNAFLMNQASALISNMMKGLPGGINSNFAMPATGGNYNMMTQFMPQQYQQQSFMPSQTKQQYSEQQQAQSSSMQSQMRSNDTQSMPQNYFNFENQQMKANTQLSSPTPMQIGSNNSTSCERHNLKGCILCAMRDNTRVMSINMSAQNIPTQMPFQSTVRREVTTQIQNGPCERHRLTSCFLCSNSSNNFQVGELNKTIGLNMRESENIHSSSSVTRNPLFMEDTKCALHSLSNCVLCVGVKAMARKIIQGSPSKKQYSVPDSMDYGVSTNSIDDKPYSSVASLDLKQYELHKSKSEFTLSIDPIQQDRGVMSESSLSKLDQTDDSTRRNDRFVEATSNYNPPRQAFVNHLADNSSAGNMIGTGLARKSVKELSQENSPTKRSMPFSSSPYAAIIREASDAASYAIRRK
jgi:hypothetical protein